MTIRKKQTVLINAFMSIFVFAFLLSFMPFHLQAETAADNVALNNAMPNGGVNPVYSPDGKRIAFTSGTMHAQSDIWIIDPDGGNPKRLTFSGANEMSWSSDGRYIYYQKNYTGYRTYLRINIEGEPVEENFVTMPEHSTGMTLSPDGKKIAYLKRTGEFTDLYIMDRDGNNERGLTESFAVKSYQWDAGGKKIFFGVGIDFSVAIFTVDIETLDLKHIYNGYTGNFVYSNEVDKLAFSIPMGGKKYQAKIITSDGSGQTTIETPHAGGLDLSWSRNGERIFYLGPDEKGENALWSADPATGKETRITPAGYQVASYSFSPDGGTLAFSGASKSSYGSEVWQIKGQNKPAPKGFLEKLAAFFVRGPKPENLIKSSSSEWAPVSSPGGDFAAYISNTNHRGTVEIVNLSSGERISISNLILDNDSRVIWLAEPEHLAVYNKQSIQFFNFKGETAPLFYKEIFYVDANLRENKLLVNAVKKYTENPRISLIEFEGVTAKKETVLLPENEMYINPPADIQPKWSFKGDELLFIREQAVWKMSPDGSGREKLIDFKSEDKNMQPVVSDPAWSIRSDKITFTVSKRVDEKLFWEIWVMDMDKDGSGARSLASYAIDNDFYLYASDYTYPPFFNATGDGIMYTAVSGGLPNIHEVSLSGGKPKELTSKGGIFPTLLPDEGMIIYVSTVDNLERLHAVNTDGTEDKPFKAGKE